MGLGHAYDLTHILARAIELAGTAADGGMARLRYRYSASDGAGLAEHVAAGANPETNTALHIVQSVAVAEVLAPLGLAVEVAADQRLLSQPLNELSAVYLMLGIAAVLVALLLGIAAGRRLVHPLRELERGARSVVVSGSFDHRFLASGVDEVARLGDVFNRMLERLGQAYASLKQQAAALRESEQNYRAIFDTTTAAILELDISRLRTAMDALRQDGVADLAAHPDRYPEMLQQSARHLVIVNGNPAARRMFQVQYAEDLVGPLERMFPPESYRVLQDLIMAVDEQQRGFSAKGFVGELRLDLDELLETIGRLPDSLERALNERLRRLTQETIPEALGFIEASVDKIDTLTRALLELSRAGSRDFQNEAVDMQALVKTALEALAYPIEKAGIQIEVGELPTVWIDRSGVEQVVDNLLRNAISYLKPGVQGKVAVIGEQTESEVVFSVRDNGIGIAEDELQRIFEPFRRPVAHATPGEGMGLTFVQTLVRRMGGRVWCESELGEGSTFRFAIPVDSA